MAPTLDSDLDFEIFSDASTSKVDDFNSQASSVQNRLGSNRSIGLHEIPVSNIQNRPAGPGTAHRVESLATEFTKLNIRDVHRIVHYNHKPNPSKSNTCQIFGQCPTQISALTDATESVETVPEALEQGPPTSLAIGVSDGVQHYIELSDVTVDDSSFHPLALAAQQLPPADKQVFKHRKGEFEWLLTLKISNTNPDTTETTTNGDCAIQAREQHFGCNLLPNGTPAVPAETSAQSNIPAYTLLVTPLEVNEASEDAFLLAENENMALAQATTTVPATPAKTSNSQGEAAVVGLTPTSGVAGHENGSSPGLSASSRSPVVHAPRIEDPIEALDKLEDQLEEFNVAALLKRVISPELTQSIRKSPLQSASRNVSSSGPMTPQPKRPSPRPGVSSVRIKPAGPMYSPSLRKSASMIFLDSPKLKGEDKALMLQQQQSAKKATNKGVSSLLPPKPLAKSSKPPTIPSFELPGDAVARRLKEKREARLSIHVTGEPDPQPSTTNPVGVRRTKSAKPATRPTFELPGEAISRRKREEREAKIKAEEEELRRRREFKAKPPPSGVASTVPRETVSSRTRRTLGENQPPTTLAKGSAKPRNISQPLSNANNQNLSRGRNLAPACPGPTQLSRANSTSTSSINGKRSSVSIEDVQQQRIRGREIYQRDGCFAQDKEAERRDREAMARLAREQAAERSRMQSREWAEKQKQKLKRMTIGSLRDVMA